MKIGARWGGVAAAGVALVTLGACGNPIAHVTTERSVGNAIGKALGQPGLNLQISLGVTSNQLLQMNRLEHGSSSFTPQVASAVAHTSVVVNVYPGHGESIQSKQFASDPSNQLELALKVGGTEPVDIRDVAGTLYGRADIPTLLSDFGQSGRTATKVQSELEQANAYLPGLAALGQGRWVSLDRQQLAPLLKLGGSTSASNPQDKASAVALIGDLKSALINNTSYVNQGDHGGRTEYQLTVQAHAFLEQLSADLSNLAGSTPGASSVSGVMKQALARSPQTVILELWVKDNKAQEVDLDVNQFVHHYPFPVPVRVLIASASPVRAPASATPLQISGIAGLLGGLGGRSGSGLSQAS